MKFFEMNGCGGCPECGSDDVQSSTKTDYCGNCGYVFTWYP